MLGAFSCSALMSHPDSTWETLGDAGIESRLAVCKAEPYRLYYLPQPHNPLLQCRSTVRPKNLPHGNKVSQASSLHIPVPASGLENGLFGEVPELTCGCRCYVPHRHFFLPEVVEQGGPGWMNPRPILKRVEGRFWKRESWGLD